MTQNGTYGFSVILSLRATLRCKRDDIWRRLGLVFIHDFME
jgi:hypothetical protein